MGKSPKADLAWDRDLPYPQIAVCGKTLKSHRDLPIKAPFSLRVSTLISCICNEKSMMSLHSTITGFVHHCDGKSDKDSSVTTLPLRVGGEWIEPMLTCATANSGNSDHSASR